MFCSQHRLILLDMAAHALQRHGAIIVPLSQSTSSRLGGRPTCIVQRAGPQARHRCSPPKKPFPQLRRSDTSRLMPPRRTIAVPDLGLGRRVSSRPRSLFPSTPKATASARTARSQSGCRRNNRPSPASSDSCRPGRSGLSSTTGPTWPVFGLTSNTFAASTSKATVGHAL